jgi:arylsulfatase A-like enzyme
MLVLPLLSVFGALLLQGVNAATPKHILFVVIDDAGFSDFSYKQAMYNISGPLFPTPVIDSLALEGVRLESYYVHALCSPSRGAFLSGRYAYTTGGNAEVIVDGVPDQLPTNIRIIPGLLAQANWSSAAYGKWDVVSALPQNSQSTDARETHPFLIASPQQLTIH